MILPTDPDEAVDLLRAIARATRQDLGHDLWPIVQAWRRGEWLFTLHVNGREVEVSPAEAVEGVAAIARTICGADVIAWSIDAVVVNWPKLDRAGIAEAIDRYGEPGSVSAAWARGERDGLSEAIVTALWYADGRVALVSDPYSVRRRPNGSERRASFRWGEPTRLDRQGDFVISQTLAGNLAELSNVGLMGDDPLIRRLIARSIVTDPEAPTFDVLLQHWLDRYAVTRLAAYGAPVVPQEVVGSEPIPGLAALSIETASRLSHARDN